MSDIEQPVAPPDEYYRPVESHRPPQWSRWGDDGHPHAAAIVGVGILFLSFLAFLVFLAVMVW